jgi:hypothetical protein
MSIELRLQLPFGFSSNDIELCVDMLLAAEKEEEEDGQCFTSVEGCVCHRAGEAQMRVAFVRKRTAWF